MYLQIEIELKTILSWNICKAWLIANGWPFILQRVLVVPLYRDNGHHCGRRTTVPLTELGHSAQWFEYGEMRPNNKC